MPGNNKSDYRQKTAARESQNTEKIVREALNRFMRGENWKKPIPEELRRPRKKK